MKVYQILLYPLSIVYRSVTSFRNHLYNIQYKPSFHFETTTISVGNLSAGGTGKSPMVEYLIRLLKEQYKIATLSRGYGRKSKGFRIANSEDNAETLGDEPFQFYLKFRDEIVVSVGEERAVAIPEILFFDENTEVILLDDAYQHLKVARDLNILLTTFDNPFFSDFVLPAGRLREAPSGAGRADLIVVTKCPKDITATQKEAYSREIKKFASDDTPVFYSTIEYGDPLPIYDQSVGKPRGRALLVSGLANPDHFEDYCRARYDVEYHFKFKDHHHYTAADIQQIKARLEVMPGAEKFLLTTEKDMVKFINPEIQSQLSGVHVYYLPIKMKIIENATDFDNIVINTITKRRAVLTEKNQ